MDDYTSGPHATRYPDTQNPPAGDWEILRTRWSPRPTVRVDRDGDHSTYIDVPAGAVRPDRPHALHLADTQHRFHLLGFDFDDHHGDHSPWLDSMALRASLELAGIPHLVCASGPGEGVHVWVRLAAPAQASAVRQLAQQLDTAFGSFDPSPVLNSKTGCLRAPGSPHRRGGFSEILSGDLDILPVRFAHVARALAGLAPAGTAQTVAVGSPAPAGLQPIDVAADGSPRLRGQRRQLSAQFQALARKPVGAGDDASAIAWSIMLACAHARWTQADLERAALQERWPGLEHLQTVRTGDDRTPRPNPQQHLAQQWARAVTTAAEVPAPSAGTCSDQWEAAAGRVAAFQQECDAQPSRWGGCDGIVDRRVLDALCLRVAQAARMRVQMSVRDWALIAGLDKSTVAAHLKSLRREGWVVRVREAAGPWAAVWELKPGGGNLRSVQNPTEVIENLGKRLESARQDIWCARGFGPSAWAVWRAIQDGAQSVPALLAATGLGRTAVKEKLASLTHARLVDGQSRRVYTGRQRLAQAAVMLGVKGAHDDKKRQYTLHSAAYVWWLTDRFRDHLSGPSDALAEWGHFPDEVVAADTDPRDVTLAYGATSHGPPPEVTTWAAAIVMQENYRHRDPDYWRGLVADARAALPAADAYGPAVLVAA